MIIDIPERILRAAEIRRSSPTRLAISRKTMLQKFEKIPVNTTILILFPCLLPCFLHFLVVFPVSIGTITPTDHHLFQYIVIPPPQFFPEVIGLYANPYSNHISFSLFRWSTIFFGYILLSVGSRSASHSMYYEPRSL